MSPPVDPMALSNSSSSHHLSSSRNSSTDSMGLFSGKNGWASRLKKRLGRKKDDGNNVSPPAPPSSQLPINERVANTNTNAGPSKPPGVGPPRRVIAKPGINRTESERRDRLVEAPLSSLERRTQRIDARATSNSLAPIPSRSVNDLHEDCESVHRQPSIARQSWAGSGSKFPTTCQAPATPPQVSQPSVTPTTATTATRATSATAVGSQPQLENQTNNLERQTTATSTLGTAPSVTSRSTYEGPVPIAEYNPKPGEEAPDWTWILNLSMHFRDHAHREKFFVTYAQRENVRRRVTVSCDYRDAEPGSLEWELSNLKSQKEKSIKIYESIKEALPDIQFYDTTTNLKLQTDDGRLNVHVTEDMHEIIYYPAVNTIAHLDCAKFKESDLSFDSHLSGFVYKVSYRGQIYIKKEIPSPDTVDEFLYEINALYALRHSQNVIKFGGCVLDDRTEKVKGLLISFAPKGALLDILYNERGNMPWALKESWARQIVAGLADIHEAGYVQGDFTLSNIVIDEDNTAKIIDINRRGCPVGWEPPEITKMLKGLQRIGIYIGVKSDIFQLGMCLWGIAMEIDEPEYETRPLTLKDAPAEVPGWYKEIVELCLAETPQARPSAKELLAKFGPPTPLAIVSPSGHESSQEGAPLSPLIVEAVAPAEDPNRSSPPSPALPPPQVEFVHLSGLKYQIPVPEMPHSPLIGSSNMVDTEESYEKYEGGIEQNTKLEEEVMMPLDEVVDGPEPVPTTSTNSALAAASAAWGHGKGNGSVNGSANGSASKQAKPAALDIPAANRSNGYAQNGKGKEPRPAAHVANAAAERELKGSSGGSAVGGSGGNSPVPPRHTDSGFAEIAGDETPVSPKTVVPLKNQQTVQQSSGRSGRG